jgi:hypothetical protein
VFTSVLDHQLLHGPFTEVVVELPIDPPFAGNLLVQASGDMFAASLPSHVLCRPWLGSAPIGEGSISAITPGAFPYTPVVVTGGAKVSAGAQKVIVICSLLEGTENFVTLTAFALVTGG